MRFSTRLLSACLLVGVAVACGSSQRGGSIGSDCEDGFCDQGPTPTVFADAAVADADADASPAMCPSTQCSPHHTTCVSSQFPCDVDLMTDMHNCGDCGVVCPFPSGIMQGQGACVGGHCGLTCTYGYFDCDGIPDNGCELFASYDPLNCGACGFACPAGQPCNEGKCGCPPGMINCDGACYDPKSTDWACGSCATSCFYDFPQPPDWEAAPSSYWGCKNSTCQTKCVKSHEDCNGDPKDGCEVDLTVPDNDNCGGCGIKCGPGTTCRDTLFGLRCECPAGTIDCSRDPNALDCTDLTTDRSNCGGCGIKCPGGLCVGGRCTIACPTNTADCNGMLGDGCEKNLSSDPDNCGACGHRCEGPGQPCIDGQCAVEACGGPK